VLPRAQEPKPWALPTEFSIQVTQRHQIAPQLLGRFKVQAIATMGLRHFNVFNEHICYAKVAYKLSNY
jgi:hypothetical protein